MPLVPLADVRHDVLAACGRLGTVRLPAAAAAGLVVAAPVRATEPVPGAAASAMDGYAVRSRDTAEAPALLTVTGEQPAGPARDLRVEPGRAVRIMTGGIVPEGADAVVRVERVEQRDGAVLVPETVAAGSNIRPAGDDVEVGQDVIPEGTVIGAPQLGLLASLGLDDVIVYRRVRVGVLSTGDELAAAAPGTLAPGRVRDANRPVLRQLLIEAGAEPVDLGRAGDDRQELVSAFERAADECDVLLTTGGVSVGDYDLVRVVLDELGDMRWSQLAIKPAKPFAFGRVGSLRVFGLPGNPVAAVVSFELLARPAIRRMMGHVPYDRPRVRALADAALTAKDDGRTSYVPAVVRVDDDGRCRVAVTGRHGSHQLTGIAGANALAVVPPGPGVGAGEPVEVLLLAAPLASAGR